jgi:hypothetical protein
MLRRPAEPNSLAVMMAFADRDALVEDDPATYIATLFGTSWSAHTALSTPRGGVSRTPAAAEGRLGPHAITAERS